MEMDRLVSAVWWSNERLAGLPPAGRLAWLWMASCADRDGLLRVDKDRLARSVGLKPPTTADSALMLLSAFDVCLLYADDMVWLCDFPGTQPDRGAYRVEANFDLVSPSPSDVREIVSNRIGRIATEKECKDLCPRAYGLKREPRSQAYDARVQEVWVAWRDRQQRPGACRFTPSSQRIIRGAMREAPAADLIALIDYAYESAEASGSGPRAVCAEGYVNPDQLEDYLRSKSIVRLRNESSGTHAITDCPLCEKVKHLYVNLSHDKLGLWDCKRCGANGHMNALREAFGDKPILRNGAAKDVKVSAIQDLTSGLERALGRTKRGQSPPPKEAPKPKPVNRNSPFAFREGMDDESHKTLREMTYNETTAVWNPVMSYLQNDRKLELETIIEFNLGAHSVKVRGGGTRWFLTIPVYDPHGRLLNMRFRTIPGPCPVCNGSGCDDRLCKEGQTKKTYMRCPGKPSALFNAHRLDADKSARVYITEGEMDVIAMWQYGVVA